MDELFSYISWTIDKAGLGWLFGFIAGLYSEEIKKYMRKPKLSIKFKNSIDYISVNGTLTDSYTYVRGSIENTSSYTADNCIIFIKDIYISENNNEEYKKISFSDPLQLHWSAVGEKLKETPINIQSGVLRYFDIIFCKTIITDKMEQSVEIRICSTSFPERYAKEIKPGARYLFEIFVVGDNVKKCESKMRISWNGKCGGFTIYD